MSDFVISDLWACLNGYDFTSCQSEGTVTVSPDIKDYVTANDPGSAPTAPGVTPAQPYKKRVAAAADFKFAMVGYFDGVITSPALLSQMNLNNVPLLFGQDRHVGDEAWMAQVATAGYKPTGKVNDVAGFSIDASGNGIGMPGSLMGFETVSASGATTPFQLGAVASGKSLYMGLQVVGRTGTATFTATHKTATTSGGSYTSRYAFSLINSSGPTGAPAIASVAGPITDTWHELAYVIGGTGTITFRYVAGVR